MPRYAHCCCIRQPFMVVPKCPVEMGASSPQQSQQSQQSQLSGNLVLVPTIDGETYLVPASSSGRAAGRGVNRLTLALPKRR
jgi:hypothetical protein